MSERMNTWDATPDGEMRIETQGHFVLLADVKNTLGGTIRRLEHILEYWNGDSNEDAVRDALDHVLDEAAEELAILRQAL